MKNKKQIIQKTFNNKFSIENYKEFILEFFNEINFSYDLSENIEGNFSDSINSYLKIGNYSDSNNNNIIILTVELKSKSTIDNARSMQRNFIAKILKDFSYDGAIVAFYNKNISNWRLSFVRLDYSFINNQISVDLTPAKRFSYLLGENEPNHTAQEQLLPILENETTNPTIDEIEEAFSVEKVTRNFFYQYKEKYLELLQFLLKNKVFIDETKELDIPLEKFADQFAKKLMGQLTFLYFIQKKGWLGVPLLPEKGSFSQSDFNSIYNNNIISVKETLDKVFYKDSFNHLVINQKKIEKLTQKEVANLSNSFINTKFNKDWGKGDKSFIRTLFNKCVLNFEDNFFNKYLEPLFYEALNKNRVNLYYNYFQCKIPFLNGGLFEPLANYNWQKVQINIPNSFFSNIKIKGIEKASGLLDIFDRYNFTMNESEPLEKEVAVDPEMLGKIFENLLEESNRKSKGAFYTPREIVHYMCQENIIYYLMNNLDLPYKDLKEFILFGEIIKDSENKNTTMQDFKIKTNILKNIQKIDHLLKRIRIADPAVGSGAYPLGMLNEIVKIRTLITDYILLNNKIYELNIDYELLEKERTPYNIKLETIKNCIFAVDIEPSAVDITKLRLWLSVVVDQEIDCNNKIPKPLPNLDMNIHIGNSIVEDYEGIKLFDSTILYSKYDENIKKKGRKKKVDMQQLNLFFNPEDILQEIYSKQNIYFNEHDDENKKFLIERINILQKQLIELELYKNTELLKKYRKISEEKFKPYFIWELEFARVFQEKRGFDIVIGNPPYGAFFDNPTKKYLKLKYPEVPDFESADYFISKSKKLVNNKGISSFIIPNTILTNVHATNYRNFILDNFQILEIVNTSDIEIFKNASVRNCILTMQNDKTLSYTKLINAKTEVLNNPINVITNITNQILHKYIRSWLNLFYVDQISLRLVEKIQFESNKLIEFSDISQGLIPYDKYKGQSEEIIKKRIYHSDYKKNFTYKKELKGKDVSRYSLVWNKKIWISYGNWLANPRSPEYFNNPRILIREITNPRILATFTTEEYYNSPSIINIINFKKISSFYILGILNSKLLTFYHKKSSPKANKGAFPKILIEDLKSFPIKISDEKITQELNLLVKKRLEANLDDNDILSIEKQIDFIVFNIYDINIEEQNHIDKFV